MSCNGCRILRKGCSDTCILRPCLQWIDSADAQAHATVFVAKFFGRAGLFSSISAVPPNQRPALFKSLLFEAAGRTVSPVTGAVGLLSTDNWRVCQAAVETILRGGVLKPIPQIFGAGPERDGANIFHLEDVSAVASPRKIQKRRRSAAADDVDLSLRGSFLVKKNCLVGSSSMNSEESVVTTCGDQPPPGETQLLNLFLN